MNKQDNAIRSKLFRLASNDLLGIALFYTLLFICIALLFDVIISRERQFSATENGRQVVICSQVGILTGYRYTEYVCARGNDIWKPVPFNE